jgi:hypothetical protein
MSKKLHAIPAKDPVSGGELYVSELANDESGVRIKGAFELPRYAKLDAEQSHFLETFLRCRGTLSSVEKELGISYPTVRARLDSLLTALGLSPVGPIEEPPRPAPTPSPEAVERKRQILEQLERGEISPEDAKAQLRSQG